PLNNYNVWFCQFSAEEIGTMGSRVFLDAFKEELLKNQLYQINFDMVSCKDTEDRVEFIKSYGIIPKKTSSSYLISILDKINKEEAIQLKGHTLLSGAHTDSLPFHLLDLNTIDFSTPTASKYSHTKEDQPDKVNPHVLLETYLVVKSLVLHLDNPYNP
ncbi:MAG: M28 family peptidase, partial [Candidatus Lokiarchaeota archaeon]